MAKLIQSIKSPFLYLILVGVGIFLLVFVTTSTFIGYSVKSKCEEAQKQYNGDCVKSLISLLDDENVGLEKRNSAIWALGQFGDRRALPVLEKYYTGEIPSKEPQDKTISQYELKKAINLTSGGLNITAPFWR